MYAAFSRYRSQFRIMLLLMTALIHQEIINTSDQLVASELSDADVKAGYWVNEDPSLQSIQLWAQLELWRQCD